MTDNGKETTVELTKEQERALDILDKKPISAWPWPRIVVGVLQERAMSHADDVFYNFWAIAQQGTPIFPMPYTRTDIIRNQMAIRLLQSDYTHVLMLDIDHKHPPDIVQRLARWVLVEPEIQVVGGSNHRRSAPFDPCWGFNGPDEARYYPPVEWGQGILRVDILGTGSILIAREVFELIPPPWFAVDYSYVWKDTWPGEDIGFSKLCEQYGVKMYVDPTLTSPHMADAMITEDTYKDYLAANGEVEKVTYDKFVERNKEEMK